VLAENWDNKPLTVPIFGDYAHNSVGYAHNSVAYRFLLIKFEFPNVHVNTMTESRDATFFEDIFLMKDSVAWYSAFIGTRCVAASRSGTPRIAAPPDLSSVGHVLAPPKPASEGPSC
jgi:hypothetical protein